MSGSGTVKKLTIVLMCIQLDAALMFFHAMLTLLQIAVASPGNAGAAMLHSFIQLCVIASMLFINITAPVW
jgi:hypothetical protein